MPKKLSLPTRIVTLRLFDGDFEILGQFYPEIKANEAIRVLVHNHCAKLLEAQNRAAAAASESILAVAMEAVSEEVGAEV